MSIEEQPWGSHPVLDPNYSSAGLRIQHEGLRFTRLDKARLVADWDVALQSLRVCWTNPADMLNCGRCEKCVRTMTELLVLGKLAHSGVFPQNDVSGDLIRGVTVSAKYIDAQWRDLIPPLARIGRFDLVEAIKEKSTEYNKHLAWTEERDWKGTVKRFDRRFLAGDMFRTYKALREFAKGG